MATLIRIAERVLNTPLLIHPEKLGLIASVLEGRIGIDASAIEVPDAIRDMVPDASRFVGNFEPLDPANPSAGRKPYRTTSGGVAVIPVLGSLVGRGAYLGPVSGMTSYEGLKHQIQSAAADGAVTSIILDMDSPGGEAVGAFEVGEAVRAAAGRKPVLAVVNGMAASAAYAIAAGATKIITSSSGISGSIGVVMMHADYSKALADRGVRPTIIKAGARKAAASPVRELTDEDKALLQAEVDRFFEIFVSHVSAMRAGLSPDAVRALEARTFIGADAVAAGLADEVGSFEAALAFLTPPPRGGRITTAQRRAATMSEQTTVFVQADLDRARAEGHAAGREVGANEERTRVLGILNSDEAKGREAQAIALVKTGATLDMAKAVLGTMPEASAAPAVPAASLANRVPAAPSVTGATAETVQTDASKDIWSRAIARVNTRG